MTELEAIEEEMRRASDPVVTVPELADRLDASDTHIRGQLRLLERAGAVERKDVGARATAWWHEDRVTRPHVAPEDHPDQSGLDDLSPLEQRKVEELEKMNDDAGESDGPIGVEAAVDRVEIPGRGKRQEQRVKAVEFLLRHLRDGGEASAKELRELSYEHGETGYADAMSWWKNCASAALSECRDMGAVELVDGHDGVWSWTGA